MLLALLLILYLPVSAKLHILSWNLCNFGKSKDQTELTYIASILKKYDIIAIQEVSASAAGPDAVNRLIALMSNNWGFVVSDPTNGKGTERYCYVYKKSKVSLYDDPWLEQRLDTKINREPFMARFVYDNDVYTFATIHTVPTKDQPENEIKWLHTLDQSYPDEHLIILGDFNLTFEHESYDELKKRGFDDAVQNQKTSLKKKPKNGEKFYQSYDHILYETDEIDVLESNRIDFTMDFNSTAEYLQISDHVPVFMIIK